MAGQGLLRRGSGSTVGGLVRKEDESQRESHSR